MIDQLWRGEPPPRAIASLQAYVSNLPADSRTPGARDGRRPGSWSVRRPGTRCSCQPKPWTPGGSSPCSLRRARTRPAILAGLPAPDAAALISSVYGGPVDERIVQALGARTGGNPFYLKESAKLLASEGALVAVSEVPEGVRDVLRRRLARLPPPAVAVLRLAATVGQEADVEVLVDAADTDEDGVITGLEAGIIAGLLAEPAPGRVRFVHALVRDTVYADLTQLRLTRMHARVGAAIRRRRPDDVPALAHHYLRAASADTAQARSASPSRPPNGRIAATPTTRPSHCWNRPRCLGADPRLGA
jgi:hypothetical protein